MKPLWILVLFSVVSVALAVEPAANGDAAWAEIAKAKKTNAANAEIADKLKAFYKQYPDHAKASDAWIMEQSLRPKSAAMKPHPATAPETKDLRTSVDEALGRIKKAHAAGREPALGEMERSGRKLTKEFPEAPDGWEILLRAAEGFGGDKARQLYTDIKANGATQKLKATAHARLQAMNAPAQWKSVAVPQPALPNLGPVNLAFKSIDGRPVNLAEMKGKVVLIDFWATWCGPCRAEMPALKKAYAELHDKGFEIIGVSFDTDLSALLKYVVANEIAWPQFCDTGGWENAINKQFGIRSIPTMYLVDKNGILRDRDARVNLVPKVQSLLKE